MAFTLPMQQFSLDPVADAEERLRQAMAARQPQAAPAVGATVLPRTRKASAGGTLSNQVNPENELGSGRQMLSRALSMYGESPDLEALNEFARKRADEGNTSMLNALAAQFAGERFQPIQTQYLKRASAAQDPIKIGNYGTVAGGKFVADPFASRDTQADALLNVGGKLLDNEEAQAREARLASRMNAPSRYFQQGGAAALPDGRVVQTMFDPQRGYLYSTPQGMQPLPADARPTTPSTGGPLSQTKFIELRDEQRIENSALNKLNKYFSSVQSADVGFKRLASQVSANAKTLFGSGLSPEELSGQVARGQLQGLLGLFRETVVGPGVMTEQDAIRVLNALGGDFNELQNPQTVESLLRDLYQSKYSRVQFLENELKRSNAYFGEQGMPITAPAALGGSQPSAPAGRSNKVVVDW